jgi:hypothetical protein
MKRRTEYLMYLYVFEFKALTWNSYMKMKYLELNSVDKKKIGS